MVKPANPATPPTSASEDLRLGELLVKEELATEMEVASALRQQRERANDSPLGTILVEREVLSQGQLDQILDASDKRPKLGSLLVRSGVLTVTQLDQALSVRQTTHERLGQILVRLNYVTEKEIKQALARQGNVSYVDLDRIVMNRALSRLINQSYAKRHRVVPIAAMGDSLTICVDDPSDSAVADELARSTGRTITVVTADDDAISRAITRLYGSVAEMAKAETLELVSEDLPETKPPRYAVAANREKTADSIIRRLLGKALESRVTDIHIEMLANRLQVRFRIDGVLEPFDLGDLQDSSHQFGREIVSRIKILSRLDITERRRPQDGSFRVKVNHAGKVDDVDLRVSFVPTHYGESVVIRLLDRRNAPSSLDQLHLPPAIAAKLRQVFSRSSGVFLVTGPTGSGKSTTLYASLMSVYKPKIRVLTAEDPIEYLYEEFSQSEVNEAVGNTFSTYLRAFLRHDPEVIMVGEIRDEETAEMVFRAAQTGHLLLSTLHTNSAVACIPRLLDLKVDADSIASTIIGVMSQRLVRQVCQHCQVEYQPSAEVLQDLFGTSPSMPFIKGRGCSNCGMTGYRGRLAIAELWTPSHEDILLINKRAPFEEIFASARTSTLSMADCAWDYISHHKTTVEELVRVLPYKAIHEIRLLYLAREAAAVKAVASA